MEKIETIAKEIYGADGIEVQEDAQKRLDLYTKQVCVLPVEMAAIRHVTLVAITGTTLLVP